MPFARHLSRIEPFHVMRVLAEAKVREAGGQSICHLEVGEPDFPSAQPILQAGIDALSSQLTHYTAANGLPELRQAISSWYRSQFRVDVSPERILVTPGASGALQLLMGLLLNPGDEILLTDPGYPCNRHLAILAGARPVSIPLDSANGFIPECQQIRDAWTPGVTRVLLLASPSNPTGTVIPLARLREIAATVRQLGGVLVVDEIYQGLVYDLPAETALELGDDIYVINSFSKYFGMTGWRVGWMVGPQDALEPLIRLAQNIYLAAPTPSQYAALAAFSPDALKVHAQRRDEFARRRDFLLPAVESLGFRVTAEPQGAFYLYCDYSDFASDGALLLGRMLDLGGVAATPGVDFGDYRAAQHLRFAYTRSIHTMGEGIKRLQASWSDIIESNHSPV